MHTSIGLPLFWLLLISTHNSSAVSRPVKLCNIKCKSQSASGNTDWFQETKEQYPHKEHCCHSSSLYKMDQLDKNDLSHRTDIYHHGSRALILFGRTTQDWCQLFLIIYFIYFVTLFKIDSHKHRVNEMISTHTSSSLTMIVWGQISQHLAVAKRLRGGFLPCALIYSDLTDIPQHTVNMQYKYKCQECHMQCCGMQSEY